MKKGLEKFSRAVMKSSRTHTGGRGNANKPLAVAASYMKCIGSNKPKKGPLNILVNQDHNMGFVASIIVKKFGLEKKNKITWVTKETEEKFRRYPKAIKNYKAAKSAGGLTVYYKKDLTSMESVLDLNQKLYDKIYLICPRFTEDIKAGEDDAVGKDAEEDCDEDANDAEDEDAEDDNDDDADVEDAEDEDAEDDNDDDADVEDAEDDYDDDLDVDEEAEVKKKLVFDIEEQEQAKTEVIAKNKEFVKDLLRNAASLISKKGVIIVLHHTRTPYSEWNLDQIAVECGLEKLDSESFNSNWYPHFSPLKAGSDLNLKSIPSAFHCYRKN